MFHGFLGTVEVHQAVIEIYTAGRSGAHSKDSLQKLRTSRSNQTVESEDLSFSDIKGYILQMRLELCGQVLNGQNHVARRIIHRREAVLERTSYHGGDQLVHIRIL